jgi:YggT family protein
MIGILAVAISRFCELLTFLLMARAVLSWFVNPYGYKRGALHKISGILTQLTEPIVSPCRKLLRNFNTGMFDFSLLVAMLAVWLFRRLAIILLSMLL